MVRMKAELAKAEEARRLAEAKLKAAETKVAVAEKKAAAAETAREEVASQVDEIARKALDERKARERAETEKRAAERRAETERNAALAENRANTVISWLTGHKELKDVKSQIYLVNNQDGIRTVNDPSTRGLNAKLNRCVKVRIRYMIQED